MPTDPDRTHATPASEALFKKLALPEEAKALPASESIQLPSHLSMFSSTWHRRAQSGSEGAGDEGGAAPLLDRQLASLPTIRVVKEGEGSADLKIVGELGRGGMGVVEQARQRSLQREVAIKRVPPHMALPHVVAKLLEEARITGALTHPNIVPVHALGVDQEGQAVLVMKKVEGVSWRSMIRDPEHPQWAGITGDRLSWHIGVLTQISSAIELAHSRGIVHRDIKPENVMIGAYGAVYLLDWGLAAELDEEGHVPAPKVSPLAREGGQEEPEFSLVGTPSYMAPEMLEQRDVGRAADIYLLGATLHEVLTGAPRHRGANLFETLLQIALSEPVALGEEVPAELTAIMNRATAKDPEDRYASVAELREALVAAEQHRDSAKLAAQAQAALAALEAALEAELGAGLEADADAESDAEADAEAKALARYRAAIECRFGFKQALELWPGNQAARAGLDRVLGRLVELALARRDPASAHAWLEERSAPEPALKAKIEALRERIEAERREVRRLKSEAHELDPRVMERLRGWQLLFMAGLAFVIGTALLFAVRTGRLELRYDWLIPLGFPPILTAGLVIAFTRLYQRSTLIHRRLLWIFFFILVMVPVTRWYAYRAGIAVEAELGVELINGTMTCMAAAILLGRRYLRPALVAMLFSVLAGIWPERAIEWMILGTTGGFVFVAIQWIRGGSEEATQALPSEE